MPSIGNLNRCQNIAAKSSPKFFPKNVSHTEKVLVHQNQMRNHLVQIPAPVTSIQKNATLS